MKTPVVLLTSIAAATLFLLPSPEAKADVSVRVNVGTPYYGGYYAPRYASYPAPVYYSPAPVYYAPAPVVYTRPVVVGGYYAPSYRYYGGGYHHHRSYYGGRHCR